MITHKTSNLLLEYDRQNTGSQFCFRTVSLYKTYVDVLVSAFIFLVIVILRDRREDIAVAFDQPN